MAPRAAASPFPAARGAAPTLDEIDPLRLATLIAKRFAGLGHADDWHELLGEAWECVEHARATYRPGWGSPVGWCQWKATRMMIDRLRVSHGRPGSARNALERRTVPDMEALDRVASCAPDPAEVAERREDVWRLFLLMTPRQRQAILLRVFGGYTWREIARALAIADDSGPAHLTIARRRFGGDP